DGISGNWFPNDQRRGIGCIRANCRFLFGNPIILGAVVLGAIRLRRRTLWIVQKPNKLINIGGMML
ncbi:unnamed protein product, partial [Didymodactylos carnosus]